MLINVLDGALDDLQRRVGTKRCVGSEDKVEVRIVGGHHGVVRDGEIFPVVLDSVSVETVALEAGDPAGVVARSEDEELAFVQGLLAILGLRDNTIRFDPHNRVETQRDIRLLDVLQESFVRGETTAADAVARGELLAEHRVADVLFHLAHGRTHHFLLVGAAGDEHVL